MDKQPQQIKFYRGFLSQIDKLLRQIIWNETNYLDALGKQLKVARDHFKKAVDEEDPTYIEPREFVQESDGKENYIEVFVSLYCSSGELVDWQRILANIGKQVISRPMMLTESEVKEFIKTKPNDEKEAYAVLFLPDSNVIRHIGSEPGNRNKLGHELVNIKDSRLESDVVVRFVHQNIEYEYKHGTLVAK